MDTYRIKARTKGGLVTEVTARGGNASVALVAARSTYPELQILGIIGKV